MRLSNMPYHTYVLEDWSLLAQGYQNFPQLNAVKRWESPCRCFSTLHPPMHEAGHSLIFSASLSNLHRSPHPHFPRLPPLGYLPHNTWLIKCQFKRTPNKRIPFASLIDVQGYSSQVSIVLAYLSSLYMEQSWNPSTWWEPTRLEFVWCILTLGKWITTPLYHAMKFELILKEYSDFSVLWRISVLLPLHRGLKECLAGCLICN